MKAALAPWLPPELLRRRKQGFMLPLGRWLRGPLRPLLCDVLSTERLTRRGWFNTTMVEQLITEHLTGRQPHTHQLWSLLMFELWAQALLDPRDTPCHS